MKLHFNSQSGVLRIELRSGSVMEQSAHPVSNQPVTVSNFEAVAQACVTPEDWHAYLKLKGIEFDGVMCSATAEDMWGLNSIWNYYQIEGQSFAPTFFKFSNGKSLRITKENIQSFMSTWSPFRQSFFLAD